jgi:hypothetical protein
MRGQGRRRMSKTTDAAFVVDRLVRSRMRSDTYGRRQSRGLESLIDR